LKKFFLFAASSIFFISCLSKPIPIAGEKKMAINNIYVEYMNIADIYYSLEKYDKALEYYKLAMQNSKLYWASYYKTAKVYAIQSNWDSALPMYRRLLRRDPDNDSLKASLAYIYAMTGKLTKAERAYKELIYLQPDSRDYIENLTAVYFAKKQYDEGKIYLDILIEKFPDSENINKFKDLLKTVEDEKAAEVPLEEEASLESEKSVFDEELENADSEDLDLPPPPAQGKKQKSTSADS